MSYDYILQENTYAPWYYLAYRIGTALLGVAAADTAQPAPAEVVATGMGGIVEGFQALMAMGQPLVVGLLVLAVVFAVLGYLLVQTLWRLPAYLRLQRWQARR